MIKCKYKTKEKIFEAIQLTEDNIIDVINLIPRQNIEVCTTNDITKGLLIPDLDGYIMCPFNSYIIIDKNILGGISVYSKERFEENFEKI